MKYMKMIDQTMQPVQNLTKKSQRKADKNATTAPPAIIYFAVSRSLNH